MARRREKLSGGDGWSVVRECSACRRPESECICGAEEDETPATVTLRMEKRRGKPSTILTAVGIPPEDFRSLVGELKSRLATGGSGKGAEGVLQGDHRERVRALLKERGIRVKG